MDTQPTKVCDEGLKRIAYLAPDIPGKSSTFVYNEIFAIENSGISVSPFSVHAPPKPDTTDRLKRLYDRVVIVYDRDWINSFYSHCFMLKKNALGYARAVKYLISDVIKLAPNPKLALGMVFRFYMAAKVAKKLIESDSQHLHIHFAHVPADIGMYAAYMAGIPFSVTAHANDIYQRGYLLKEKTERAKFIATISRFNLAFFEQDRAPLDKLHIVRCGVDSSQFSDITQKSRISSPVKFGFLGRLVEKKGVAVLIDACQVLKQRGYQFNVEIVGDGPLMPELQDRARTKGIENITFVGALEHRDVFPWMEGLDAFVMPCVKDAQGDMDGIPVVLMEAMLKGIPVISTEISGVPELVQNTVTGLLAETENEESLADSMEKLITEDASSRVQRLSAAYDLVCTEYDQHANANKLMELMAS